MLRKDLTAEEALSQYQSLPPDAEPECAVIVAVLAASGYSNRRIRRLLAIEKVYTVSHFKRVGAALSEDELVLWLKNRDALTLGHMRAAAKLSREVREPLLRTVVAKRLSVREVERRCRGEAPQEDFDTARYAELMSEHIGRPVRMRHDLSRQRGQLTLTYHSLDDLERLSRQLGFDPASVV